MVTRQDLEQQLQPLDPRRPEVWLSEGWWAWQREQYDSGGRAWFFLTLEKQIKTLARKYKSRPRHFLAALNRTMARRAKRLRWPWVNIVSPSDSLPAATFSQQQRNALADVVPTLKQAFLGGPDGVKSLEPRPKQILGLFRAFAAKPAGRRRIETYDAALKMFVDGQHNYHFICLKTNQGYSSMTTAQQVRVRNRTRSGIMRRLSKQLKLASETSSTKTTS